jgi:hypothetical protein
MDSQQVTFEGKLMADVSDGQTKPMMTVIWAVGY